MALTKITANVIEAGAISTASIADTSITADKLAATLDLTGKAITVATASAGDNDTTVASTAFVTTAIANLTDSAPAALDTLNELAAALNDDANFSTTVTNSIATKLPLAGGTLTGDLNFGDSDKAVFGAGSDLQIYHDGSHSYITEAGTGNLYIQYNDLFLQSNTGENYIYCNNDAQVVLYYDNSAKLATTSTGIDVTGTATMDGLTSVNTTDTQGKFSGWSATGGAATHSGAIELGQNASYQGVISYDSANETRFIFDNSWSGTGSTFEFRTNTAATPKTHLKVEGSGDISFYEDTGTTAKFFWDASAESLGIGTTSPSAALNIVNSGLSTQFRVSNTESDATIKYGAIVGSHYTNAEEPITGMLMTSSSSVTGGTVSIGGGISSANAVNNILFYTAANNTTLTGSERMRITPSGNVGIGTTSPVSKLHLADTSTVVTFEDTNSTNNSINTITNYEGTMILSVDPNDNSTATESLRFLMRGSEAMRIDSSGRVGIGTSSPIGRLDIKTGNVGFEFFPENTNDTNLILNYDRSTNAYQNLQTRAASHQFLINTSEKMRIDSSGNVGIGTTSPANALHLHQQVVTGIHPLLKLQANTADNTGTRGVSIDFVGTSDSSAVGSRIVSTRVASGAHMDLRFHVARDSEAMRIDSSGNLLVGKTSASKDNVGAELKPDGRINATMSSGSPLLANRKTSDGDIATFQKDNTTVGSIGVFTTNTYFANGDVSLAVNGTYDVIHPRDGSGDRRSDAISLGGTIDRFKDLYLSGTANFGSLSDGTITITGFADEDNMVSNSATLVPTQQSVKAYVDAEVAGIVDSAPGTLDTLNELAAALNDDADFSTTVTNSIALKAPLASPDFTGDVTFDTSTLVVDSTNNRVGIGTSSPTKRLHVKNSSNDDNNILLVEASGSTTYGVYLKSAFSGQMGRVGALSQSDGDLDGASIAFEDFGRDIAFRTNEGSNNSEKARILANGNVGIGTTSPDVPLEVVSASPTNGIVADFVNSTNAGGTTAAIKLSNADSEACDVVLGANRVGANFGSDFFISLSDGVDGSNQERFRITEAGNVGIGTSSPSNYSGAANDLVIAGSGQKGMTIATTDGSQTSIFFADSDSGAGEYAGAINYFHNDDHLEFYTASAERMRIDSSGNVGIGTTNPTTKLHLSGDSVNLSLDGTGAAGTPITSISLSRGSVDWGIHSGIGGGNLFGIKDNQNSAYRLAIDTSGNVGIGTTVPEERLHVLGQAVFENIGNTNRGNIIMGAHGSGVDKWASLGGTHYNEATGSGNGDGNAGVMIIGSFSNSSSNRVYIGHGPYELNPATEIYLGTHNATTHNLGGSTRMIIDSAGNVGINETSPDFSGFGSNGGGLELDDVGASFTAVRISHGATGDFYMAANTGAAYLWGKANSPTVIATNNTEAMRIDESQSIFINTTSGYGTPGYSNMWIQHSTGRQRGIAFKATSTSSTDTPLQFFNGGAGVAGQITYTYSATTYSTSSDYRLKENVVYDWDAITRLKQLKPCRFNWIADETDTPIDGFIAHEAAEVVPNSVIGEKDAIKDAFLDADGNEIPGSTIDAQTMDHAKLVPLLTKALQEQQTIIESLEARIAALES